MQLAIKEVEGKIANGLPIEKDKILFLYPEFKFPFPKAPSFYKYAD